jgi:membrane protease subunit HflC
MKTVPPQKNFAPLLIGVFAVLILITQTFFVVPETQQALVLQFGKPVRTYEEPGLKAKIPFIQQVKSFDSRVLDIDLSPQEVILADQKRIVVDSFARYRIVDMLKFQQALAGSEQQAQSRLDSLMTSTIRSTLGNVTMIDVLSEKRAGIMAKIRQTVNDNVQRLGVEIVDVRIGRADLPEQTSQSVFARMKSEREREAADFRAQGQELSQQIKAQADAERTVILANAEKEAQILRGAGDQQAIEIFADAYGKDPAFFEFYRTMEAYKKALPPENTNFVLTPSSGFLKYMQD